MMTRIIIEKVDLHDSKKIKVMINLNFTLLLLYFGKN